MNTDPRETLVDLAVKPTGDIEARERFRGPRQWWRFRRERFESTLPAGDSLTRYVQGLMHGRSRARLTLHVYEGGFVNIDPR